MDKFYLCHLWDPKTGKVRERVTYDMASHVVVVAPTGASKGVSIEIPNLLLGFRNSSILSIDPSGQNAAVCAEARRKAGSIVRPLNPMGLHVEQYPDLESVGFNPLAALDVSNPSRFFMRAVAIAEGMVPMQARADSKFFDSSAQGLATWLIMYVKLRDGEAAHLGTVRDLATEEEITDEDGKPVKGLRATAARAVAMGHPRLASLAARYMKESRSNNDVVATFDAATRWLLDDQIRADLRKNGIDFGALKDRPTTVFLMVPAGTELEFFGAWLRIVINCALDALYARGGEQGVATLFMLSEAAQIGRLQPVLAALGQGRKYGIRLAMVLQDINQLRSVYGHDEAGTVISNSGCVFAFNPGNDTGTAEFLSKLSGEKWVMGESAADDPQHGGARVTITAQRERLWTPEKIRSLPDRHGLTWIAGEAEPVSGYCPPYWDIRACRRAARRDPYHGEMPPRQTGPRWRRKAAGLAAAAIFLSAWWLHNKPDLAATSAVASAVSSPAAAGSAKLQGLSRPPEPFATTSPGPNARPAGAAAQRASSPRNQAKMAVDASPRHPRPRYRAVPQAAHP